MQGFGAALISPAALSIITTTFAEGPERNHKAMGVWAAIATGGAAAGLLAGGILVEFLSWPWIFFVNVPVGLAAGLAALRYVPESRDAGRKTYDIPGAVTVTASLVALVYGIVSTERTAEVALGARPRPRRRLAERVRRDRAPLLGHVASASSASVPCGPRTWSCSSSASELFAMFFFNTLYIQQQVLRLSPLQAGLAFLPFTVGIAIGAGLSQPLMRTLGLRTTAAIGLVLGSAGILACSRDRPGRLLPHRRAPDDDPAPVGMGLTFVPVTLLATSGLQADVAGLASGLFNTSQQIGGAIGLALLSTIAVNRTTTGSRQFAEHRTRSSSARRSSPASRGVLRRLRPAARGPRPPADDAEAAGSGADPDRRPAPRPGSCGQVLADPLEVSWERVRSRLTEGIRAASWRRRRRSAVPTSWSFASRIRQVSGNN